MPIPGTLARKITADFRAEKKYGGRKYFCDAGLIFPVLVVYRPSLSSVWHICKDVDMVIRIYIA